MEIERIFQPGLPIRTVMKIIPKKYFLQTLVMNLHRIELLLFQ